MPTNKELAGAFLQEFEAHGEKLDFAWDSQKIVLKSNQTEERVPLWRLDLMVFQFLAAHAVLTQVSVADVVDEVLSRIM
jgi:hypothetical protein